MKTVKSLSKYFSLYLTIDGFTGETYTYKKRTDDVFPEVSCKMHKPKCQPGSWLYIAIDGDANIQNLNQSDTLYVGSQTQDRMFRGDGLKGKNFHHAEIRKGNGMKNLEEHLSKRNSVKIFTLSKDTMEKFVIEDPDLMHLQIIHQEKYKKTKIHPGYWLEQIILSEDIKEWAWNTKGVDSSAMAAIKRIIN